MTLSDLIERVLKLLRYDLDGYAISDDGTYVEAEIVPTLNDALIEIGKEAFLVDVSVTLTLTADTCTYNLRDVTTPVVSKRVLRPLKVFVAGNCMRTADDREYGLWSYRELERRYPTWRTDASTTPDAAVQLDRTLILAPAPSQAVVDAGNAYLTAQVLPDALDASDMRGEPDLPEELHEQLAKLAAVKLARPYATEGQQFAKLDKLESEVWSRVAEVAKANRQQWNDPGTIVASNHPDFLVGL